MVKQTLFSILILISLLFHCLVVFIQVTSFTPVISLIAISLHLLLLLLLLPLNLFFFVME